MKWITYIQFVKVDNKRLLCILDIKRYAVTYFR